MPMAATTTDNVAELLRGERLTGLGRKWLTFILGLLYLLLIEPKYFARGWPDALLTGYFLFGLAYTAYIWKARPGTGVLLAWYGSFILDLGYVGSLVYLTRNSHLVVLLYPLIMLGAAINRPRFRDFVVAGLLGHTSYFLSHLALYRSLAFYFSWQFWAVSMTNGAIFLFVLLVVRLMAREKMELQQMAIQLQASNRRLEELAVTDDLTGLYNHRQFHDSLNRQVEMAQAGGYPLTLVLLDVDYLKLYNDTQGHRQGDEVLKVLATLLRQHARSTDVVCRVGNDEFGLLLVDALPGEGREVADCIRRAFAGHPFPGKEAQPLGTMTLSVGLATFPLHAGSAEELLRRAEDALFKAKQRERNSTQVYYSLLEEFRERDLSDKTLLYTIQTLLSVINAKDRYTYGHSERVVLYATLIAEEMGLGDEEVRLLKFAAFLHDIGKIEIARDILLKEGSLSEQEKKILELHPVYGVHILEPLRNLAGLIPIVRHHHERFDGNGYPDGLRGEEIRRGARILAVADSFDAMRSNRPYRAAMSFEGAMEELRRSSGSQFDPAVVKAFRAVAWRIREAEDDLWSPLAWREAATAGR